MLNLLSDHGELDPCFREALCAHARVQAGLLAALERELRPFKAG